MRALLSFCLVLSFTALADEAKGPKLTNESEAGIVIAGGNSDTQTYSLKHQSVYVWDANTLKGFGRYLLGKTAGLTTAENWEVGLRYERALTEALSIFAQYRIDRNPLAGLDLRHSIDAGAKYYFVKDDTHELFNETGYRFMSEKRLAPAATVNSHLARVYFEYNRKWSASVGSKLGLELLPNLSTTADYQTNLEASVTAILTEVFSLKTGYLGQYRNRPASAGKKRLDSLFTTSLVAKF